MTILHIGTHLFDGAGLGMLRLHEALRTRGLNSIVLTRVAETTNDTVTGFLAPGKSRPRRICDIPSAICHRLRIYDTPFYRALHTLHHCSELRSSACVSSPFTRIDILRHPWICRADIIHLHWTSGFVDWPSFFRHVKQPVVWTLRDENPALGFWHYRSDMPLSMSPRLQTEDKWLSALKTRTLQSCRSLSIVSLSRESDSFFSSSAAFAGRRHLIIPNPVDDSVFVRGGGAAIRKEFGIPLDATVLSFVAQHIADPRKGFQDLDQALTQLDMPKIIVFCAGKGPIPKTISSARFISLGAVNDPKRLAAVFSASNLFVTPSKAETFGKTTTEALACGTPVVSYPNGGAKDIVGPMDGILADGFTPDALERALRQALSIRFNPDDLRSRVIGRFSRHSVSTAYENLYRTVLQNETEG